MSNTYIILGWACGIGGGQIYTDNKCRALAKKGYRVFVFYPEDGKIVLPNISTVGTKQIRALQYLPSWFSRIEKERILQEMLAFLCKDGNPVFIESNDVKYSYWGELLAEKLNCRHFVFALEAYFPYKHKRNFLWYKLNRGELAGTRIQSLPDLFGGDLEKSDERNKYLRAFCTNSVQDVPCNIPDEWISNDIKIGYIGRESKPCFTFIMRDLVSFISKHPDKTILVLCIGCNENNTECAKALENYSNCKVVFTGSIFPIPLEYLKLLNVAIGSSGSIGVAAKNNVISIKYLDAVPEPRGVIGYDIKDLKSIDRSYSGSLCDLLDDILFHQYCDQYKYEYLYEILTNDDIDEKLCADAQMMMSINTELSFFKADKIVNRGIKGLIEKICFCNSFSVKIIRCFVEKYLNMRKGNGSQRMLALLDFLVYKREIGV